MANIREVSPQVPRLLATHTFWTLFFTFGTILPPLVFPRVSCIRPIAFVNAGLSVSYLAVIAIALTHFPVGSF